MILLWKKFDINYVVVKGEDKLYLELFLEEVLVA